MKTKNLLLAAGVLFLASACKENNPVQPAPVVTPIRNTANQVPELITTDDSVYVNVGKGRPVKGKPTPPQPTNKSDGLPLVVTREY